MYVPTIEDLTGLSASDLAEALANNPRAYMALKGAVAEKHLEKHLSWLQSQGQIESFARAASDFEKDFTVVLQDGSKFFIECKNAEVAKQTTKAAKVSYLKFLVAAGYLAAENFSSILTDSLAGQLGIYFDPFEVLDRLDGRALGAIYQRIPQSLRESGIPRYRFSLDQLAHGSIDGVSTDDFLTQFENPEVSRITVDFQRTRNAADEQASKENTKSRLYTLDEIDVLGVCLFSRTLRWEFIFSACAYFPRSSEYSNCYDNRLSVIPGCWSANLMDAIAMCRAAR